MAEDLESIEALVKRFQAEGGDQEEIFRKIFQFFYPRVSRFFVMKGFSDKADDLAQVTFFEIYKGLPRFKGESRFSTWLFQVMWNVCHNQIRNKSTSKRKVVELSLDSAVDNAAPDPLAEVITREQIQALQVAVQELPHKMRLSCLLYLQGLGYREIATILGTSNGSVRAHIHQARKRLQEKLGEAEE